jgi:hypothetical protein
MFSLSLKILSLTATIMFATSVANGQVQLSNLGIDNLFAEYASADEMNIYGAYLGQSFTTGGGTSAWLIHSVTLALADAKGETTGALSVAIYSQVNDGPGALLGTLIGEVNPLTAGNYTYTSGSLQLAANTQYWLVVSAPFTTAEGSGYGWRLKDSAGIPGHTDFETQNSGWGVFTNNSLAYSFSGSNWDVSTAEGLGQHGFSIDAQAIPEPSTFLLGAAGVALSLFAMRRRTSNKVN